MTIAPFKLERYFAKYEFNVKILMSSSDCESLTMTELLDMASPQSLDLWNNLKLGYTETQGHPALREEISRFYENIPPENLMVAAPEEAIYIAMQTLLKPEDHVIVLSPAYQSLYEIATSIGCQVSHWTLKPGSTGWQADLSQLKASITPQTRLLVLNMPNNPTGYLPSHRDFDAIIELARKYNLYIFADEMYRLMEFDPEIRLPSMCDVYEKGISLSGLSKSMALPGLRIGWLATQETVLLKKWMAFKDYTTICNSAPSEILGIIAVQNKNAILWRNLELIRANLIIAEDFISDHPDHFLWHRPNAGSIAFPQWSGKEPVEEFCHKLLDRYGMMIVPGSLFDYPGNHFRLGLGRKNFAKGIGYLNEYLQKKD
jgi:aspartate/methionine/tyrosine aminotransferase